MSRPVHHEIKKILCEECKTTHTTRINLPRNRGGHTIIVTAHRASCKSSKIEFCMQDVDGYSYYSNKCCRPVKGHFKGGSYQWIEGVPACGMHLAHERKQREKNEAEESAREVRNYLHDVMNEKLKTIEELTGIVGKLHYQRGYNYFHQFLDSEYVLIKADDLLAAIDMEDQSN
jgi:hypothetical protein